MTTTQAYLFLVFTLNGIFIGLLFDFFRILRKIFKTANLVTYIEDIIFWILTGISIIFCLYKFSGGSLRLFMFIGLNFGIIGYMFTISKRVINITTFIIFILRDMVHKIMKFVTIPLKFIFNIIDRRIFRPVYIFLIRIVLILTKKLKKSKNT